jgi:hypothetical protein
LSSQFKSAIMVEAVTVRYTARRRALTPLRSVLAIAVISMISAWAQTAGAAPTGAASSPATPAASATIATGTGTGTKIGTINIEQAVVGTNEGQRDFEALRKKLVDPSAFGGAPGIDNQDSIYANDTCAGDQEDVTGSGYSWGSSDTSVATLPSRALHTVAVGSATGSTLIKLQAARPPQCGVTTFGPQQSVQVSNGIVLQQNWGECIVNDPAKGQLTLSVQWMNGAKTCLWTGMDVEGAGYSCTATGQPVIPTCAQNATSKVCALQTITVDPTCSYAIGAVWNISPL